MRLSSENGVQHIGLSSLVMMEPIFYGSCALSETERCFLQNERWTEHGGQSNGPFIPSCQFRLRYECLGSHGIKENKMTFQHPDKGHSFLSHLTSQIQITLTIKQFIQ